MACIIALKATFLPSIEVLIFQHLPVFFCHAIYVRYLQMIGFTCDGYKCSVLFELIQFKLRKSIPETGTHPNREIQTKIGFVVKKIGENICDGMV